MYLLPRPLTSLGWVSSGDETVIQIEQAKVTTVSDLINAP